MARLRWLMLVVLILAAATAAPAQDAGGRRRGEDARPAPAADTPRDAGQDARRRREARADAFLGVAVQANPSGPGLLVAEVRPGTPAAGAGLRPGDVLLSMNGEDLSDPGGLGLRWTGLKSGEAGVFMVLRDGAPMQIRVVRGAPATAAAVADSLMAEAAGRVAYVRPASPARQVAEFNTLTTAVIGPSGQVLLLGTYDPAYATGPLPYAALLQDAVARPDPALSLDSIRDGQEDAAFRQLLDQEAPRIANDAAYGADWVDRFMGLLWTSAVLEADRNVFAARLEQHFGITRDEFEAFRAWRNAPAGGSTPPGAREYVRKFYTGGGLPEVGKVLALMNLFGENNDPALLVVMGEALGRGPEVQVLVDRALAIPEGSGRLDLALQMFTILYGEVLARLQAPEAETREVLARFQAGNGDDSEVTALMDRASNEFMAEALGRKVLHGFTLSGSLLGQLYPLPVARARVNTFGAPLDSPMMRIFFQSDYRMKGVCADGGPDGLPSDAMFFFDRRLQAGPLAGTSPGALRVRYWLVPDQVQMQASPDGSVVRFGTAAVRVRSEMLEAPGADATAQEFLRAGAERYAAEMTSRYEALARQSPSLHALREAAKVVALVRWAQARGLVLQGPATGPSGPALPATVPGLWGATFLVGEGLQTNELEFWRSGGVSFAPEEGSAWVQARPDPTVSGDVLQQLAASTVLSEQAARAAGDGKMELARELAEQSAQAMIGGPLPVVPEPVMARVSSPADEAKVSQAALEAVDTNLQALEASRAEIEAAAPLQATSPAEYARAMEASRESGQRSEDNLERLQDYLAKYRQDPASAEQVAAELLALRPGAPPAAGGTVAAGPVSGGGTVAAGPVSGGAAPSREASGPTREQMQKELQKVRADLARLTEVQRQLTRTMLGDVAQFDDWQAQVEQGYDRSWSNLQGLLENEVLYYAKRFLRLKNAPLADQDAVKRLAEAVAIRDVAKWGQEPKKDWEWVGKGIVMLAGAAGLNEELNRVLVAGSGLIDASTDLATSYLAWRAMAQLRGNLPAFEAANQANLKAMNELIQRLRDLEARLGTGGR